MILLAFIYLLIMFNCSWLPTSDLGSGFFFFFGKLFIVYPHHKKKKKEKIID